MLFPSSWLGHHLKWPISSELTCESAQYTSSRPYYSTAGFNTWTEEQISISSRFNIFNIYTCANTIQMESEQRHQVLLGCQSEVAKLRGSLDAEKKAGQDARAKYMELKTQTDAEKASLELKLHDAKTESDKRGKQVDVFTAEVKSKTSTIADLERRLNGETTALVQARGTIRTIEANNAILTSEHEKACTLANELLDQVNSLNVTVKHAQEHAESTMAANSSLAQKIAHLEEETRSQSLILKEGEVGSQKLANEQKSEIESLRKQLDQLKKQADKSEKAAKKSEDDHKKNYAKFNEIMSLNRDRVEKEKQALQKEVETEKKAREVLEADIESFKVQKSTELEKLQRELQNMKDKQKEADGTIKDLKAQTTSNRTKEQKLEKLNKQAAEDKKNIAELQQAIQEKQNALEAEKQRALEIEKEKTVVLESLRASEASKQQVTDSNKQLAEELQRVRASHAQVQPKIEESVEGQPAHSLGTSDVSSQNPQPLNKKAGGGRGKGATARASNKRDSTDELSSVNVSQEQRTSKKAKEVASSSINSTHSTAASKMDKKPASGSKRGASSIGQALPETELVPDSLPADDEFALSEHNEQQEVARKKRRALDAGPRKKYGTAGRADIPAKAPPRSAVVFTGTLTNVDSQMRTSSQDAKSSQDSEEFDLFGS
jgi:hypothetical protein